MDNTIRYVIEQEVLKPQVYTLYSIVDTNFGGPAQNYIFEGTKEECVQKMEQLQALDELAQQDQQWGLYD